MSVNQLICLTKRLILMVVGPRSKREEYYNYNSIQNQSATVFYMQSHRTQIHLICMRMRVYIKDEVKADAADYSYLCSWRLIHILK